MIEPESVVVLHVLPMPSYSHAVQSISSIHLFSQIEASEYSWSSLVTFDVNSSSSSLAHSPAYIV